MIINEEKEMGEDTDDNSKRRQGKDCVEAIKMNKKKRRRRKKTGDLSHNDNKLPLKSLRISDEGANLALAAACYFHNNIYPSLRIKDELARDSPGLGLLVLVLQTLLTLTQG